MVTAYVLITAKSGSEREVLDKLREFSEIEEAKIVYGEFDILAKVKVSDVGALNTFLIEKLRTAISIEKTSTLIVAG